ncbi:MAG: hypothetical protein ACFWTN_03850 [Clostridium sp.]|jgi:hypothetical protein
MKNNQKENEQALQIPIDIQQRCGFADAETLAVTAAEGVCVIHKGEMTALELYSSYCHTQRAGERYDGSPCRSLRSVQ